MIKAKPILQQVPIHHLNRGQYQPRRHFDPVELQELADSIKVTNGLLQPIIAKPLPNNQYEIIAGERRWRAAQLAGLTEVSCLISSYSPEQALQAAIIENVNRSNLNPIEEAKAYQRLIDEFHYLHDEVAAVVGKSRTSITNLLRLLKLIPSVQDALIMGQLMEGHGKILAGLTEAQQKTLANLCITKRWSVRKTEKEAKKLQQPEHISQYSDVNVKRLENALSDHLGNAVQIKWKNRGGGSVHIQFHNIDELEGYFKKVGFKHEC